ncbi:ABC transporter ATP-binding protein [Winogradskya humida]|uniref:Multidrug ABC transporter permease n=1 Tax=Winogradskya humida TaxID=113566 RepID=A0ABQ4A116_9ACTN|nr:ABC transporter ATP-binding protein [Actinoplanes humidus]GIE24550.1 multidrug ABC transporter permease [Actinoplanes humidus]
MIHEVRTRWRLLGALRYAGPRLAIALWIAALGLALLPTATGLATGALISRLMGDPHDTYGLTTLTLAVGALALASQALEFGHSALRVVVSQRINARHRMEIAGLAAGPRGIRQLEDPAVQDDLSAAVLKGMPHWIHYSFGTGAVGQLSITTRTIGACVAAAVLATFSWPAAICLLATALLVRAGTRREWLRQHGVVRRLTPGIREEEYLAEIVSAPWAAKETRIFGLGDWVTSRYRELVTGRVSAVAGVRRQLLRRSRPHFLLLAVVTAAGLVQLVVAAVHGSISPGELALYLGVFWALMAVSKWDTEAYDVEFAGVPALLAADRLRAKLSPSPAPSPHRDPVAPGTTPRIQLAGVGFRYEGGERPVLHGLDLTIEPGELVALVGTNGAGKTTLTKLLTGLYQPAEGVISVGGTALADLDPAVWQGRVAVVFQESTRYELTFRDNVTLGAPGEPDPVLLEDVARRAGITGLVDDAPLGWDTPLASAYSGGIDLSGGQWQRVALARALYAVARGARLLVLDEPTAHLDVRAEADLLARVTAAARGASVLLVSHRLATVRQADRIAVLTGGRITESGTHDQLMALNGTYAEMFHLQADRFTGTDLPSPGKHDEVIAR